jgi:alanine-synthesizing transaminase
MFSSRIPWGSRQNRLTQLLMAKRSADAEILDLTESNPTRAGLSYSPEILRAFDDPRMLVYQPEPAGAMEAREAVAAYYVARGLDVQPGQILLTASTSEAYAYLFKLLADPGSQVLVPRPSYPLFELLAGLEAVEVRQYPLVYHGEWSIDIDGLAGAVSRRTKAVVVVHPNNPTGSFVKWEELRTLCQICEAHGIALISDEVFSDYAFAPDPGRVASLTSVDSCLAFSLSGLSKVAGLPQMKLAWIAVSGPSKLRSSAMERLEWIADTYLSVGSPVQCVAAQLIASGEAVQRQIRSRTASNLAFLREALAGSPAGVLAVEGGWCATVQLPRFRSDEEWALELLEQRNVFTQPGFFYDFDTEALLVLSLLTRPEWFREGIVQLLEILK